jgi:tripartite-type tricarboxylate transporter receptor subunit TctC
VQAVHVPFTGGGPAVTSAIGNHVDAIVLTLPTVVPPITQGASARHRPRERDP